MKKIISKVRFFVLNIMLALFYILAVGAVVPFFVLFMKRKMFGAPGKLSLWEDASGYEDEDYYSGS